MPPEPLRTVSEVLERLDTSFAEFADGFDAGEYVLWLGSGISRERVPYVGALVEKVIEFLRSRISGSDDCVYRTALNDVLRLASLTPGEEGTLNFADPVTDWPLRERVVTALITKYSHVLDVRVGDETPDDYLVWTALDVPNVYGDPALVPDVEHYCIALLMLEGLVTSAVTANWDGLLEKALAELSSAYESLVRVVVKPTDFRNNGHHAEVIKFHGCAVLAREDESEYRDLLVARESQISGWVAQPEHGLMGKHLEVLYTDRRTLMIGLSAQDANLHMLFAKAIQDLARPWPAVPPAVVYSEEHLEAYHQTVLKLTYGSNYQGNGADIARSALLGAYGKPTLLALVLTSLTDKLSYLAEHTLAASWNVAEVNRLQADLLVLRESVAGLADAPNRDEMDGAGIAEFQREFTRALIDLTHFVISTFRHGAVPGRDSHRYEPLSQVPVRKAVHNPDFPKKAFGLLGVALALVGRGLEQGHWSVAPGAVASATEGVVRIATSGRETAVFFAKDAATLNQLEVNGVFDPADEKALVVVTAEEPPPSTRSSRSRYGRDGVVRAGRFNIAKAVAETGSADELYEAFKLAGGF